MPLLISGPEAECAAAAPYLQQLARLESVTHVEDLQQAAQGSVAPVAIVGDFKLMLKVEIDVKAERERLLRSSSANCLRHKLLAFGEILFSLKLPDS